METPNSNDSWYPRVDPSLRGMLDTLKAEVDKHEVNNRPIEKLLCQASVHHQDPDHYLMVTPEEYLDFICKSQLEPDTLSCMGPFLDILKGIWTDKGLHTWTDLQKYELEGCELQSTGI